MASGQLTGIPSRTAVVHELTEDAILVRRQPIFRSCDDEVSVVPLNDSFPELQTWVHVPPDQPSAYSGLD